MSLSKKEWEKLQGKILHIRIVSVFEERPEVIKVVYEVLEIKEYVNSIIYLSGEEED